MKLKVKPYTPEESKALLGRTSPTFVVVRADDESPCFVETKTGTCSIRYASTYEKAEKIKNKLEGTYGASWDVGTSLKQLPARAPSESRQQRKERLSRETLRQPPKQFVKQPLQREEIATGGLKSYSMAERDWVPDRIFRSPRKFSGFRPTAQDGTPRSSRFKPQGLWYACGDAWDWFLEREYGETIGLDARDRVTNWAWKKMRESPYVYEIEVDLSSMVVIRNESDFDAFNTEYGKVVEVGAPERYGLGVDWWGGIDWPAVAKRYAGIEVCPMVYPSPVPKWFSGWDVASGCIWGKQAFKSVRLIEHQDWTVLP